VVFRLIQLRHSDRSKQAPIVREIQKVLEARELEIYICNLGFKKRRSLGEIVAAHPNGRLHRQAKRRRRRFFAWLDQNCTSGVSASGMSQSSI
jgi:hypothetical protein